MTEFIITLGIVAGYAFMGGLTFQVSDHLMPNTEELTIPMSIFWPLAVVSCLPVILGRKIGDWIGGALTK